MNRAEWAELVEAALTECRGDEHWRRVWLLVRRLEREGW